MRGGTTEEQGELVGQGLCPAANPILDLRRWLPNAPSRHKQSGLRSKKRIYYVAEYSNLFFFSMAMGALFTRGSCSRFPPPLDGLPVMVVVVSGHRPFPAAHGLYTSLPLAWHPLWGEVNWPQPQPTSPPTHVRSKRESSPQIKLPGGKPKEMQKKSSGSCGCSAPITAVPTASWSAPIKKMAIDPSGGGRGEDSKDDTAGRPRAHA